MASELELAATALHLIGTAGPLSPQEQALAVEVRAAHAAGSTMFSPVDDILAGAGSAG